MTLRLFWLGSLLCLGCHSFVEEGPLFHAASASTLSASQDQGLRRSVWQEGQEAMKAGQA